MKKVTAILLTVVLTAVLAASAFAADYVRSIEAKPAPQVMEQVSSEGTSFAAIILDPADTSGAAGGEAFVPVDFVPLGGQEADPGLLTFCVISAAESGHELPPEMKEKVDNAKEQLQSVEHLGELSEGVSTAIEEQITAFCGDTKEKIESKDLVISEVFDAEFVYDKDTIVQVKPEQKIQFAFKPTFTKDDFFVLLHCDDGVNWEVVTDYEWTEAGNLVVYVDQLGVFAIAVERPVDLSVAPDAPDAP